MAEAVTSVLSSAGHSVGFSFETAAHHVAKKDPGVGPWPQGGLVSIWKVRPPRCARLSPCRAERATYPFGPLRASISHQYRIPLWPLFPCLLWQRRILNQARIPFEPRYDRKRQEIRVPCGHLHCVLMRVGGIQNSLVHPEGHRQAR